MGLETSGLTPEAKTGGVPNPNVKKRKSAGRPWYEHLTGYVGRLRRMENEEWKDSKNIIKKEDAKEAKISFLRRFYPKVSHSPGGSVKLKGGDDCFGSDSAITGRMGRQEGETMSNFKRKAQSNRILDLSSPSKKTKLIPAFSNTFNLWETKNTSLKPIKNNPIISDMKGQPDGLARTVGGTT